MELKNTGQLSLACTGNLRDNRQPRRLGSVLPSSNAINTFYFILLCIIIIIIIIIIIFLLMNLRQSDKRLRRPGIEPGSTAWKAAMLTTIPPTL